MRAAVALPLLLLVAACGPRPLQTGPTVPTLVQVGGDQRAIRTLTDLDDVRDVSASSERVYVATDLGILIHPASGGAPPVRLTAADGLPSDDVRAVVASPEGGAVVATAGGLATIEGDAVTPMAAAAPVGEVIDLYLDGEGTLWACGVEGVARLGAGGWERFGEPAACTTLVPTPEGALWVGTARGLWLVEGDVVREHGQSVLPEAYVRDVVPVRPGEVMALLSGPSTSQIGYFDGDRWYGYTIADFEPAAVGLAGLGGAVVLITPDRAYAIAPSESAEGVPLTALSRSEPRQVVSYRARITPAADVRPAASEPAAGDVRRPPSSLAEVPATVPTIDAPGFVVSDTEVPLAGNAYLVRRQADALFVAERNLGVTAFDTEGRPTALRSQDLVHEQDLQIASSAAGTTWTIGTHHDLARWRGDGLFRVSAPEGVVPQAIASGPEGVYAAAVVAGSRQVEAAEAEEPDAAPPEASGAATNEATVRIYRVSDEGWTQVTERTLRTATRLVATPFLGVGNDEQFWLGLRVEHESGEGTRMRGVAVFGATGDAVTYHHRAADTATDGADALRMPDEVTSVDLGHAGFAWLPSLSGAIRVGNSQAVVFGEARGVRGEVVTDVAAADNERIWVAAAEGVGYREGGSFEFRLPRVVQEARPNALAIDSRGHLWGAGPNGAVLHDGQSWQILTIQDGLPTDELVDVEVDPSDRVWLLARDRVILFTRP